jgi:hypothetical protein
MQGHSPCVQVEHKRAASEVAEELLQTLIHILVKWQTETGEGKIDNSPSQR